MKYDHNKSGSGGALKFITNPKLLYLIKKLLINAKVRMHKGLHETGLATNEGRSSLTN